MAESFGSDPERYDRTRPRYPDALVKRIMAAGPGRAELSVGIGTETLLGASERPGAAARRRGRPENGPVRPEGGLRG